MSKHSSDRTLLPRTTNSPTRFCSVGEITSTVSSKTWFITWSNPRSVPVTCRFWGGGEGVCWWVSHHCCRTLELPLRPRGAPAQRSEFIARKAPRGGSSPSPTAIASTSRLPLRTAFSVTARRFSMYFFKSGGMGLLILRLAEQIRERAGRERCTRNAAPAHDGNGGLTDDGCARTSTVHASVRLFLSAGS